MSSLLFRRSALATAGTVRAFSTTGRRDLAKLTILGNLVGTPETQTTSGGRELTKYTVVSNHGRGENRQASFFRVVAFSEGPSRDYLLNLQKGTLVYVDADASMRSYQDAEGGNKTSINIVQRTIEVLRRPQGDRDHSRGEEDHQEERM